MFSKTVFGVILYLVTILFAQSQIDSQAEKICPIDKIPVADSIKIPVLDFKNTDIKDILRGLGMQYGVNIFVDPDVSGAMSLYLTDVSVKNAIDFIVKRNNCVYSVDNGIVKVFRFQAPPPPAAPKPRIEFHLEKNFLDIDIKEVSVKDVARMFGDSAHLNVIVDAAADKNISARLVNIQPEKAVKALFEPNGYQVTLSDSIFYATSQSWGKGDEKQGGAQFKPLSLSVNNGLVTLEVDNASLDQLVRSISVQSGVNIVMYDKLLGDITARLSAVPVDNALRFLLQNTKFTFWKENGIYFIGSREMNQQKTTVIIPLKHIRADESAISKMLPPIITSNAVVKYNTEQNAVIIIGSFDIVSAAETFFNDIDKPVPQVLIEALVVDFNVSKIRSFGLSFFTTDSSSARGNKYSAAGMDIVSGKKVTEWALNKVAKTDVLKYVLDKMNASQIVNLPGDFKASIQALESAGITKIHSTPQIATINGNAASITIGETRYYKLQKETVSTSSTSTSNVVGTDERFEVLKFNTVLEVTPWVMDQGYVMVKIHPEFNIPRTSSDENIPPNVDTRVIESMVRLRDGQTIVLGGQRQSENIVNRSGVPFLSSIPILGWLFSTRTVTKTETQMMIFLTPHVYYGDNNSVRPDDYFGKEINKVLGNYGLQNEKNTKAFLESEASLSKTGLNNTNNKSQSVDSSKSVTESDTKLENADSSNLANNTLITKIRSSKKRQKKGISYSDSSVIKLENNNLQKESTGAADSSKVRIKTTKKKKRVLRWRNREKQVSEAESFFRWGRFEVRVAV